MCDAATLENEPATSYGPGADTGRIVRQAAHEVHGMCWTGCLVNGPALAPAMLSEGRLYAGCRDGSLDCFESASLGLLQ